MSADITVAHSKDIPNPILAEQRPDGNDQGWYIVALRGVDYSDTAPAMTPAQLMEECIRPDECFVGPFESYEAAIDAMSKGAWL